MISFRFHVVSITAVFLAIAIGVLVGTTYVDRAVVDSLENRVDRVSRNLDTLREENDSLQGQVDDLRTYSGASADFAVTGRLAEVPVLLVAVRGVDDELATQTLGLARRAGGTVPGIVWLETRWALDGDEDRSTLAAITGLQPDAAVSSLRSAAVNAVVGAMGIPAEGVDPLVGRELLEQLVSDGFLSVDAQGDGAPELGDLSGAGARVVVLTTSEVSDELAPMVPLLVARVSGAGLPTVAAEAFVPSDDGPKRGATLVDALDEDVRERVGIVDDLDQPEGRVATVLALAEVAAGRPGHFGYGSGADGVLPAWSAP